MGATHNSIKMIFLQMISQGFFEGVEMFYIARLSIIQVILRGLLFERIQAQEWGIRLWVEEKLEERIKRSMDDLGGLIVID